MNSTEQVGHDNGSKRSSDGNDLRELIRVFGKIGITSFGGPAGQIALMHKVLVEEKKWLEERQFLHALNFCMLLPGPEAMQLATYAGWLVRGVVGGLIAGILFVVPGFLVVVALSAVYVSYGEMPAISGLLFGLKAAVLAIVVQALVKVSKRALRGTPSYLMAIAAFIALAVFDVPFPIVIVVAAIVGYTFHARFRIDQTHDAQTSARVDPWPHVLKIGVFGFVFWLLPVATLVFFSVDHTVFADEALFFSKTAMVTFGGAYAVLAYVGQLAVDHYMWLSAEEMLTGLGLAETTPGPLILVLVFVGFIGAFRDAGGFDPLVAGVLGAIVTVWVTFVPCFIWIFLGAPFIEQFRGKKLGAVFAAITAAVVGVIANLSLWFALHVLFFQVDEKHYGPAKIWWPDIMSLDATAAGIAVLAAILAWRGANLMALLGVPMILGVVVSLY